MGKKSRTSRGKKNTTAPVDKHWIITEDGDAKTFQCNYCQEVWMNLTTTKQCAHTSGISGYSIATCGACEDDGYTDSVKEEIYPVFKVGRLFVAARDKQDKGEETRRKAKQKSLEETVNTELQKSVTSLLGQCHFAQGNIADSFWESKPLIKALQKLAEAAPFQYSPPKARHFPKKLLPEQLERIRGLIEILEADTDDLLKTLTMDGWENLLKLHWLAQCVQTAKGPFFRDAVDCTGVPSLGPDWTFKVIVDFIIAEGGADAVNGFVLDSPNVNKSALKRAAEVYPTIAFLLCICHIISLWFKDVYKLPKIKEMYRLSKQTAKKFKNCKWLRDQLEEVMATQLKDNFPNGPLQYLLDGATRMASKDSSLERSLAVNCAAKLVVASPQYVEKYEGGTVLEHTAESDDEYEKKDKRSMSAVLLECKTKWIQNDGMLQFAHLVNNVTLPAKKTAP